MKYLNIIENITSKIEALIVKHLNYIEDDLATIILAWKDDYTQIHIWFETAWENNSECGINSPIAVLDEPLIAIAIDNIALGLPANIDEVDIKNRVQFKEFGNRIKFADTEHNKQLTLLLNIAKNILIDCSKLICKRTSIGEFKQILSFKIGDLNNGNHPSTTAIYHRDVTYPLMHIEIESVIEDEELECFCCISETNIIFFLNDYDEKSKWQRILKTDEILLKIPIYKLTKFTLRPSHNSYVLDLNLPDLQSITIKTESDNYWLKEEKDISKLITNKLRSIIPAKEKQRPAMAPPNSTKDFDAWCNFINELNDDFSWSELNDSVEKYGIEFIYSFIPKFNKKSPYYDSTTITAIRHLLNNGDFKTASTYFKTLTVESQNNEFTIQFFILLGQKQYKSAFSFFDSLDAEKLGYQYNYLKNYYLPIAKTLEAIELGDKEKAVLNLKSITEKEQNNKEYKWTEIYILAHTNEQEAYKKALNSFSSKLPIIPSKDYFKKFKTIHSLFEHKKNLLKKVKADDILVKEKVEMVTIEKESHNFFPLFQENLESKSPMFWNVVDYEKHQEIGEILLFFTHNNKNYAFSKKGNLLEYSLNNDIINIINQEKIATTPTCAMYYKDILYTTEKNKMVAYHINSKKYEKTVKRFISETIDHIFVNKSHIVLCSLAGIEIFFKHTNDNFEFVNLISVGTSEIPYTWAKASLIIKDYLYISAGNAGLITYRLKENQNPELLHVLSANFETPFCDAIYHHNNTLILQMSGNQWVIDITDLKKPTSLSVLFGRKNGYKNGPLLMNDSLYFIESDAPIIWSYNSDYQQKQIVGCEHISKNNESVRIYYQSNWIISNNYMLISSSSYGLSLLKRQNTPNIDYSYSKIIKQKANLFYNEIKSTVNAYYKNKTNKKMGSIQLEFYSDMIIFKAKAPDHLIKSIGYDEDVHIEEVISFLDFGIENKTFPFPYDAILEKKEKLIGNEICKQILKLFSKNETSYYYEKVYFIFKCYIESIDRNILSLEYVKQVAAIEL